MVEGEDSRVEGAVGCTISVGTLPVEATVGGALDSALSSVTCAVEVADVKGVGWMITEGRLPVDATEAAEEGAVG